MSRSEQDRLLDNNWLVPNWRRRRKAHYIDPNPLYDLSRYEDLPPLEVEGWDVVHYCFTVQNEKGVWLVGVGDTPDEARNEAMYNLAQSSKAFLGLKLLPKYIAMTRFNGGTAYSKGTYKTIKLDITLCEGKVFIYARRYGVYGMKLLFDPNASQPYMRYAGYDKVPKYEFLKLF